MNAAGIVDLVLIVALAAFAIKGWLTGFIRSVFSIAALVVAWFLSAMHPELTSGLLTWALGTTGPAIAIGSRIATWIVAFALVQAIAFLLTGLLEKIGLGGLDKLLGLALGVVAGVLAGALPLALLLSVPAFAQFEPVRDTVRQSIMFNLYKPLVAAGAHPAPRR